MPAVLVFLSVFIAALVFGAISAYPVYALLSWFSEAEFHRVISRTTLVSGLLFSLLYLRYCGLFSLQGIGWRAPGRSKSVLFFQGLLGGVLILLLMVSSLVLLDIYKFDPAVDTSLAALLKVTIKGLLAGLLVGLIEELIFRGALFSGLHRQSNLLVAMLLTSLLYALVHFIKFRALPAGLEPGWLTGLEVFPAALFRFKYWPTLDASITLFILGLFLATVRVRSQSIIPCIGMHAGIVLVLKVFFYLANYEKGSNYDYLVNSYDHQFGYLGSAILLFFLLLYYFLTNSKDVADEKHSADN